MRPPGTKRAPAAKTCKGWSSDSRWSHCSSRRPGRKVRILERNLGTSDRLRNHDPAVSVSTPMAVSFKVAEDFERAHRKGVWRRLVARLLRRNSTLLPFEETRLRLAAQGQHFGGFRTVSINQIVGSVNRYHDFDRAFLPRHKATRMRWQSIDRAYYEDNSLPPIELYQLGETYFVKDGNHRVSVAREQGQDFIDAYVVELDVPVRVASLDELE